MKAHRVDIAIAFLALAALLELVTALNSGRVLPWVAFGCMLLALILLVIRRWRQLR
jgi:hypothetical protein